MFRLPSIFLTRCFVFEMDDLNIASFTYIFYRRGQKADGMLRRKIKEVDQSWTTT